ncbi:MAG: hypothetical protein ACREH9_10840 [Pseudomonadota bacterium]
MFFLFVFGLGITAFLLAVVMKVAAMYRKPAAIDQPDTAWRNYRLRYQRSDLQTSADGRYDHLVDPQGRQELAGLWEQDGIVHSTPPRTPFPAAPSQNGSAPLAEPPRPSLKDLEPALRALWEARQHRAA